MSSNSTSSPSRRRSPLIVGDSCPERTLYEQRLQTPGSEIGDEQDQDRFSASDLLPSFRGFTAAARAIASVQDDRCSVALGNLPLWT
jgi:hypothetical protein